MDRSTLNLKMLNQLYAAISRGIEAISRRNLSTKAEIIREMVVRLDKDLDAIASKHADERKPPPPS